MKQKTKPFAILIFGAPKSGKTYLAEQLSTKYHTLFLDFSTFNRKYKIKSEDIQHFLNNSAFKTKRNVTIEGCLDTEKDRSNIRNACRDAGYIPVLVWVQTDVATINQRSRKSKTATRELKAEYKDLEAPSAHEHYVTISGKFSFEIQCRLLLKALSKYTNNTKATKA